MLRNSERKCSGKKHASGPPSRRKSRAAGTACQPSTSRNPLQTALPAPATAPISSNLENTSDVRNAVQILPPSKESLIKASLLHMVQKHGRQRLLPESVTQLRDLGRAACLACDAIRLRRCRRCTFCGSGTPFRDLLVGDTFQDRRQSGHPGCNAGRPAHFSNLLRARSQCDPDDSPLPNCPIRVIVLTERDKRLLAELRRASSDGSPALRCLSSCHGMGRKPRRSNQWSPVVASCSAPLPLPALLLAEVPQRH